MKYILGTLALAASSQALISRDQSCCFSITAYGGPGGPVGQLGDGQNRIGQQDLPSGTYCTAPDGGLIDGHGRGCILTPPTTQWQCDVGASPTPGFSVGSNGTISHDGESTFFACFTGDQGAWNIYSQPLPNEPTCTPIWLNADDCRAEYTMTSTITAPCTTSSALSSPPAAPPVSTWEVPSPPPSTYAAPPAPPATTRLPPPPAPKPSTWVAPPPAPPAHTWVPPPAPPAHKPACPAELPYNFEAPHLIIPVSSVTPDTPAGTSYNGTVSRTISSIFNFDIPSSLSDKNCNLVFLLPEQWQLETSAYELHGAATFSFDYLHDVADKETTYHNAPPSEDHIGTVTLAPGSATFISEREGCSAGKTVSFAMSAVGDSAINYFQDSNPCRGSFASVPIAADANAGSTALGLYVIPH